MARLDSTEAQLRDSVRLLKLTRRAARIRGLIQRLKDRHEPKALATQEKSDLLRIMRDSL